jgi:cytochrome c553
VAPQAEAIHIEEDNMIRVWSKSAVKALLILALLPSAWKVQASSVSGSGAMLAANCANCHGTYGRAVGAMPALAGQPKMYLVEQMRAYKEGRRTGTIMHQLAKGYTEEQIDAVATFLSQQKR